MCVVGGLQLQHSSIHSNLVGALAEISFLIIHLHGEFGYKIYIITSQCLWFAHRYRAIHSELHIFYVYVSLYRKWYTYALRRSLYGYK